MSYEFPDKPPPDLILAAKRDLDQNEDAFQVSVVHAETERRLDVSITAASMVTALARSLRAFRYLRLIEAGMAQVASGNWQSFRIDDIDHGGNLVSDGVKYPLSALAS